jgi:hypothetical protein
MEQAASFFTVMASGQLESGEVRLLVYQYKSNAVLE